MQSTITTPRLKLTLITSAARDTQEFTWLHQLRSDSQTTWWTQHGQSKTPADTESAIKHIFPNQPTTSPASETSHRIAYLIHETLDPEPSRFIGLLTLRSLSPASLVLPASFTPASAHILELGYLFLPSAWHRGFATEAVSAVLDGSRAAAWEFAKVYVRAIVSVENPGSLRVAKKVGMRELGVYEWVGERAWLAGQWRERCSFHVLGCWIKGEDAARE